MGKRGGVSDDKLLMSTFLFFPTIEYVAEAVLQPEAGYVDRRSRGSSGQIL